VWEIFKNRNSEFLAHCVRNNQLFILSGLILGLLYMKESQSEILDLFVSLIASDFVGYLLVFLIAYSVFSVLLSAINFRTESSPLFGAVFQDFRDLVRCFFGTLAGFIIAYSIFNSFNLALVLNAVFIELLLFMIYFVASETASILHYMNDSDHDGIKGYVTGLLFLVISAFLFFYREEVMAILRFPTS